MICFVYRETPLDGAANMYGHPSPSVVARLRAAGADVRRTDADGTLVVSTDGREVDVRAGTP